MKFPHTIKISVTQDHINNGARLHCSECPIALAALDVLPEDSQVSVFPTLRVYFPGYVRGTPYELPETALTFIETFDFGAPVSPFTFEAKLLS